ncbi:MAG: solute:Na+ symporter, family [Clostridiales bacterium]|jgi:SSS family transporter|nr:solute:Na+ symporter, family [Clostridiales bacterium]MDK2933395.1 solute:Na+ symporter, family [Clostridiales bacterium]
MLKFVFIALYVVLMLVIGFVSMKKASTLQDFFLGGRKMGPWVSAFAYGTTYFSAVLFIGYAGKIGWVFGLSSIWIGIGNAILGSLLAWIVLAKKTRNMTHRLDASTMPEFFEKRYNSRALKIFSALIIFIFLVPYSASVYAGLSYLFKSVFQIEYVYCMLFMAILTAIYLVLGGYMATVMTDFIQGIIMIVGILLMIGYVVVNPSVGGLTEGIQRLSQIPNDGIRLVSFFGGSNWFGLLSLIVLTSFGSWGLPQMVHKFYAIKDEKSIFKATIVSTGFAMLIASGAYFVGAFGRLYLNNTIPMVNGKQNFDMIMPEILKIALPEAVLIVILLLVLSASMSTLASIVLTSSSAIAIDLVQGYLFPNMKKDKVMLLMRILCLVFIIFSFIVAYKPNAILALMSFSWGTVAGAFIGPFIYGLYWKGTTQLGAWAGMVGGFLTSIILAIQSNMNASQAPMFGMIAMIVSIIAVPVVSVITPKFSHTHISEVFNTQIRKNSSISLDIES